MSKEWLRDAATLVRDAASSIDDSAAAERLSGLADQLEKLAASERGPDHGRMARILNGLEEVKRDANAEVAGTIDRAKAEISRYRETVAGV